MSVVRRLLATQAQDPRGARLAIRARSTGLTAADVDAMLDEGAAVVSWLNRGTLHLVASEDYWWLHTLMAPPLLTGNARRLHQEGVPSDAAERAVRAVVRALRAEGPLPRRTLRERVAAAAVRTDGQALVHVLMLAALRGLVVRGPMSGAEQAYVLAREWLGRPPRVDRHMALADLARRYLAGHGPADDRDLARWSGLPLRDARAGLGAIAGETVELADGLLDLRGVGRAEEVPAPKLLGPFEPVLLGWRSRADILGGHAGLVTVNGLFRPFLLVRGRAAGTWRTDRAAITLEPFGRLGKAERQALDADAADVHRFFSI